MVFLCLTGSVFLASSLSSESPVDLDLLLESEIEGETCTDKSVSFGSGMVVIFFVDNSK